MNDSKFTSSEKRIIRALYRLDRWATKNEIAQWADGMSWNTASTILENFIKKKIVERSSIDGRPHWKIRQF